MSGSTIGGIVGAAIGFYFGGFQGAQIGYALGSAVGGYVDPTKIQGPRLSDRAVQVSSYGATIPIIYGGDCGTGNIIWSTDLVEHDVESDGKGGGPVVVNHTYSVSCAILIGEGPIQGIRRIWADAKLIYDVSEDASEQTQLASVIFSDYFVFYKGDDSQLPDPTMEAELGVGNVSAYRGYSYIVFTDIPLQDYGNRIPSFRFETSEEPETSVITEGYVYEPLTIGPWAGARPEHSAGETEFKSFDLSETWSDWATASIENPDLYFDTRHYATQFGAYYTSTHAVISKFSGGASLVDDPQYVYYVMCLLPGNEVTVNENVSTDLPYPDSSTWCGPMNVAGTEPDDGIIYWTGDSKIFRNSSADRICRLTSDDETSAAWEVINNCTNYDSIPEPELHYPYAMGSRMSAIRAERVPAPPVDTPGCQPGDPCILGEAQIPSAPDFCINCDGVISPRRAISYEVVTGTFKQLCGIQYSSGVLLQNALGPVLLPGDPNYDDDDFWENERSLAIAAGTMLPSGVAYPVVVGEVARGSVGDVERIIAAEANTTLDVIVANLCARPGMPPGTYDVTALEDIEVQGFSVARQMPARAAVQQLQQAFYWDFVESALSIKAVVRGGTVAAAITYDDLGVSEGGERPVAVVPNRAQEAELPATVTVMAPVRATGYEAGAQRARRVTTGSSQALGLELAVVCTDQKQAEIADVTMYALWTARSERQWSTTRKFAHLEPTDVITVHDGEFEYRVRITDRSEEGGVIKWRGVDEKPAAYSPNVVPGTGTGGGIPDVGYDGPTKLELIDSPLFQDTDDSPGHYVAVAGYMDSWPGAFGYKSTDDGTTYTKVLTMKAEATLGYATTVLGDFTGGNMVDEVNSVQVRMHSGSLSTVTPAQFLNEVNAALLGDELLLFHRAELIAENVYRLTGFLRGRRGTEQHIGSHAVNDRFVFLSVSSIYRAPDTLAGLNVPTKWKGITFGQGIDSAIAQDFTNTGEGLMPYSVAHLRAIPLGGDEYMVRWVRRSRIGGKWRDGVDVPLGEDSERYQVLVNGGSAVTLSDSELQVTASSGDTITVYQLSGSVGRGFPASVTIP